MTAVCDKAVPDSEAELAREALPIIKHCLAQLTDETVPLTVQADAQWFPTKLPRTALELLASILANLAAGRPVQLVPGHAELTTQQAADILNVSRPFLIGLLKAGEIDYRMVGTHRRITADSLMAYMRADDAKRRAAADELTQLSDEMGTA